MINPGEYDEREESPIRNVLRRVAVDGWARGAFEVLTRFEVHGSRIAKTHEGREIVDRIRTELALARADIERAKQGGE